MDRNSSKVNSSLYYVPSQLTHGILSVLRLHCPLFLFFFNVNYLLPLLWNTLDLVISSRGFLTIQTPTPSCPKENPFLCYSFIRLYSTSFFIVPSERGSRPTSCTVYTPEPTVCFYVHELNLLCSLLGTFKNSPLFWTWILSKQTSLRTLSPFRSKSLPRQCHLSSSFPIPLDFSFLTLSSFTD